MDSELIEILAHLDIIVEIFPWKSFQDNDYDLHKHDVASKISHEMGGRVTKNHILGRMQEASQMRLGKVWPTDALKMLIQFGSSELQRLDANTKKLIESQKEILRVERPISTLRCRRARAVASKSTKKPIQVDPGKASSITKSTSPRTQRRCERSRKQSMLKKRTFAQSEASIAQTQLSLQTISRGNESKATQTMPSSSFSNIANSKLENSTPNKYSKHQQTSADVGPCWSTLSFNRSNSSHLHSVEEQFTMMLSEISYHKRCTQEAEQERDKLRNLLRQRRGISQVPTESLKFLDQNALQLSVLKRKLKNRENLERYLSLGNERDKGCKVGELRSRFATLWKQMPMILVPNATEKIFLGHLFEEPSDLAVLLGMVFKKDIPDTMAQLDYVPPVTLDEAMQALTGAAIHCWVFESEFQPTFATITPLLQQYREQISSLCGHDALHDFDVAAHRSLFDEAYFQNEIIPYLSSMLVTRLLNAVEPLFQDELDEKSRKNLRQSLKAIFCSAIQIRVETTLSSCSLESIWPSSGLPYDTNEMVTEDTGSCKTKIVRLPICPGLRVYSKRQAMPQYSGLILEGSADNVLIDVIKALVLR